MQVLSAANRRLVFLLASVQIVHILDFVILMPLGPFLMKSFDITASQFATLVASYNILGGISGIVIAPYIDQFPRKKALYLGLIFFCMGTLGCVLSPGFWVLLFFRMFAGFFGGVLNTLVYTIATEEVPIESRGKALGIIMSAFSIASVCGVPLALWVADFFDWRGSFAFVLLLAIVIVLYSLARLPGLKGSRGKTSERRWPMIKRLLVNREYRKGYIFIFFMAFSMFMVIPFLSPYAVGNIGIAMSDLKFMYMIGGLFTIFSARAIGVSTDKWGARNIYVLVALMSIIPIRLYTSSGPLQFAEFAVMSTFFMTMVSGRMIPAMTLISMLPTEKDRASMIGLVNSLRSLGSASASFFAGQVIVTDANKRLEGFDSVGILAIIITLGSLIIAHQIHLQVQSAQMANIKKAT